ncbi:YncE family protein [Pontibacter flavimaris]|uniref:YncE family protein n=1 Tax=Pontibacter flavimaris TaxID=1797110 RepID=A0A1Q5P9Y6_9BACT|nr:YncE family protein [Pontibacter flavimaris]OKL39001.1 hypothetical protein A3841_03365 [Pontibacter flavimaris]
MKKLNYFRSFFLAATLAVTSLGFTSCDDKDNIEPELPAEVRGPFDQKGVFILNEGNYTHTNSSVSFMSDSTGHAVANHIFSKANADRPLGDVLTDLDLVEDRAYLTVNNSNKIEVVNAYTFKTEAVLENLKQPRYFTALDADKAYVTEWITYGAPGQVSVIDLKTMKITKSIPVGIQPEELLLAGGKLYVANSGANTITVINTATDAVENTITVSDSPMNLALDRNNNLWVLSAGKIVYTSDWSAIDYTLTTAGALSKVTPATQNVETYTFDSNRTIPTNLVINGSGDKLYFIYDGKTFVQDINASGLSSTVFINSGFHGLGVDPETGNIYAGDHNNWTGDGTVRVYSPDGQQVSNFKVGIGPRGFVFN